MTTSIDISKSTSSGFVIDPSHPQSQSININEPNEKLKNQLLKDEVTSSESFSSSSSASITSTTEPNQNKKQEIELLQARLEQNKLKKEQLTASITKMQNQRESNRRERSLDRQTAMESSSGAMMSSSLMMEHFGLLAKQRQQQQSLLFHSPGSTTTTSNLFLNTNTNPIGSSKRVANHQRSNSILNTSSNTINTNSSNQNPFFQRDYVGLRSSARALSSNSFSGNNNQPPPPPPPPVSLNREQSLNSLEPQQQQQPHLTSSKFNFIKDLQIRLMDTQKECLTLRAELDTVQQKLHVQMQSIRQFWSPELKKERQMRKEETAKSAMFQEQLRLIQCQYQTLLETYEQLQQQQQQSQIDSETSIERQRSDLCTQKERAILKKTIAELEMRISTQKQSLNTKDETIKKLFQLVKSVSVANAANANTTNENTLSGNVVEQLETNNQWLTERLADEERKNLQLQQYIQQIQLLHQQQINNNNNNTSTPNNITPNIKCDQSIDPASSSQVHTTIDAAVPTQQSTNGYLLIEATSSPTVNPKMSSPHFDSLLRSNERLLKEKIDSMKMDLARRDTELEQWRSKHLALESQERDLQHYVQLLKESVTSKDQQLNMQIIELDELRQRARERDIYMDKKHQQLQLAQLERHQRESDLGELKDQMDIKERKCAVLNRKIDALEEQLKDKEMQIGSLRAKLLNSHNSGAAAAAASIVFAAAAANCNGPSSNSLKEKELIQQLEQTIEQKEKLIEQLTKEASLHRNGVIKETGDNKSTNGNIEETKRLLHSEHQILTLNQSIKELNGKLEQKNKEIQEYQNEIFYLKDEVESLKTQLTRKDSHVMSLEMSLTEKNDEIEMIEEKLQELITKQKETTTKTAAKDPNPDPALIIEPMKKQLEKVHKDLQSKELLVQQLSAEIVTLKELIDDFEEQKQVLKAKLEKQQEQFDKLERQFEETTGDFELQLKEQQNLYEEQLQIATQRKKQENKQQQTQESSFSPNPTPLQPSDQLKQEMANLTTRCRDLEEALRESVSITAEREYVFAQQKKKTEKLEQDFNNVQDELENTQKHCHQLQCEYERCQEEISQRQEQLTNLEEEKVKEMNELLITKQEILLTTISEKDSAIAELEYDKNGGEKSKQRIRKLNEEKDYLHQQLKELNEKRMKLMQEYTTAKEAKDKVKIFNSKNTSHDVDGIYG